MSIWEAFVFIFGLEIPSVAVICQVHRCQNYSFLPTRKSLSEGNEMQPHDQLIDLRKGIDSQNRRNTSYTNNNVIK